MRAPTYKCDSFTWVVLPLLSTGPFVLSVSCDILSVGSSEPYLFTMSSASTDSGNKDDCQGDGICTWGGGRHVCNDSDSEVTGPPQKPALLILSTQKIGGNICNTGKSNSKSTAVRTKHYVCAATLK